MRRPFLATLYLAAATVVLSACSGPAPVEPVRQPPPRTTTPRVEYNLAPTFAANAGRLPWPCPGTVTGRFGRRTDPRNGTTTDAVGVDLATAPSSDVRAVFDGTVNRVGFMAAYGTYVMVDHGGYTTVYGNLSQTTVESGDRVQTGAQVGFAGTQDALRGSGVFFAVFRGGVPEDPLGWLRANAG